MEGKIPNKVPLNTYRFVPNMALNRLFALIYTCAILALLYHHANTLTIIKYSTPTNYYLSLSISTSMLMADLVLAFMWATTTSFRMRPILRQEFPENLVKVLERGDDFPAIDIFICTADPYKEPPMNVVNTALSLMAYDYPAPEKLSVYVSDDSGSQLTLFAFMEAAKFGKYWLPFCRGNNVMDRCPDVFFRSNYVGSLETEKIKVMYESMKIRVENAVERGYVSHEYINDEEERRAFKSWTREFTRQQHPPIIQVLLNSKEEKDILGHSMPNLVYVSREKSKSAQHHFKAGALNALLRVSAIMTNAPIILTQDCDMFSNDPQTPYHMLCYFFDESFRPELGYVQFPQRYHGLNKADIYGGEIKRLFISNPVGMDGLAGPNYVGTGCFFLRRVFFGGPSSIVSPEMPQLNPNHVVEKPITHQSILLLAHQVAGCNYENGTSWGSKLGFRYGSLVEDYYTGFRLKCEGWKAVFCHPDRPAFQGDAPITLIDVLSQNKRWAVGLLEVGFSKYSPVTFGVQYLGPLMGLCYAHYASWPLLSIPINIYSFLPQITLLNGVSIFPKATNPWSLLYVFLFVGAYGQDCLDYIYFQGNLEKWVNEQRMWIIKGLSSYMFGLTEYMIKHLGIATQGFNVTSKIQDDEQSKRYEQGSFEFGVASPMFVPFTTAAILNLIVLLSGFIQILVTGRRALDELFFHILVAGFGVLNSIPIYNAMVVRKDKGRMPTKITFISTILAGAICVASYFILSV